MTNVELEIFADEVITPNRFNGERINVIGLGCLFVPVNLKQELVTSLMNQRCLLDDNYEWFWYYEECLSKDKCKPSWHKFNDCEIHYAKLRTGSTNSQKKISKNWLEFLIKQNKENRRWVYFNILFIDLDILEIDRFGSEKIHENIYNKFFRTNLHYGLKAFFGNYKEIRVKKVYHDEGSMEFHQYFPYLNLRKLDYTTPQDIVIEDVNIGFINSDHRKYMGIDAENVKNSHLIQFIDLILGFTTQNIYYLSNDALKMERAMDIRELVYRLLKNPNNVNSSYNYYGRQKISFFPRLKFSGYKKEVRNLNGNIEILKKDQFYSDKRMEMPLYDPCQQNLDLWCG
ncbi:MAG: hypothetical protein ACOC1X_02290 [Promethearchaeota archaeon]